MFGGDYGFPWKLFLCTMVILHTVYDIVDATEKKKDYYEILGVARDATQKDIKRAFRKLAIKYHPDKNKEEGAEDKFRDMAKAYDTLSNAEKRKKYDQFGEEDGEQAHKWSQGDFHDIFGSFDDMFRQFHHPSHHQQQHYQQHQPQHDEHFHFHHSGSVPHFTFSFDDLWDLDETYDTNHHEGHYGDSFFGGFVHEHQPSASHQQNCKRTTKHVGNTIIQTTECY